MNLIAEHALDWFLEVETVVWNRIATWGKTHPVGT
jgi:hypothetical protein